MESWGTATVASKQLSSLPCFRGSMSDFSCRAFYVEVSKFSRRGVFSCCIDRKGLKVRVRAVDRRQTSSRSQVGIWEDPDDGSESDSDEEEGEFEEDDLDYESDWEEEKTSNVGTSIVEKRKMVNYEDELAKEIDQLLEPHERAILDQNPAPNLEKISTRKWVALHTLALAGQIHLLDQLLENGVSIDSVDKDGRTALHVSVIGKKEAVISHLLRKGANPHAKDKNGVTLLHHAVQVGAMQTVKLLIKYNVDVNMPDNEGWTPLHVAMQSRNRDITKVLLVNGADRNRKNNDGKTPMDLCIAYGKEFKSYDLAKLLKIIPANRDL